MSVVLVTPDDYQRVRKTVSFLAVQTVSSALQIVIVAPAEPSDGQDDSRGSFHSFGFVACGPFRSPGHPRSAGVAQCVAPIVAFAEDHCFPDATWAETLIRLHEEGWAAVSPALKNANPGPVSWADTLLNFGPSMDPAPEGSVTQTPWHNTSYRRELLCEYGGRLEHKLEAEILIQEDLVRGGLGLYLAGDALASHVNVSRWQSFLLSQLRGGQLYGAARAEACHWCGVRRWFYAALFPLLPARRAPMIMRHAKRTMEHPWDPVFLLASGAGLVLSAIGEGFGYAVGAGSAARLRMTYEFDRVRHVRAEDLKFLP